MYSHGMDIFGEWTITDHHARYWNGVQQGAEDGAEHDKSGIRVQRN
jgi:hypothetical protein